MLEGRDELVNFVLSIPEELAEFKGNKERLLMKPKQTIDIIINGIHYENLKALQILEDEVVIFYGSNMIQSKFKEVHNIDFL